MRQQFRFGNEVLFDDPPDWLFEDRIGILCNPASVDSCLTHVVSKLAGDRRIQLAALFGPQHGTTASAQDNMIETGHGRDEQLGIPVYSLYSEVRAPTPQMLESIDTLLVDLQDVGTRVYTFAMTLAGCIRAASQQRKRVVVLDRPNPLGGQQFEGNLIAEDCYSFVGEFPVPMRHGLTLGELGRFVIAHEQISCDYEVVPMEGWRRASLWPDLLNHWVAPSPNMPTFATALVYPGAVLIEGTNLSEGRGTTQPFEIIGAPYVAAATLADALNASELEGVFFRAIDFEPTFQKHAGQLCGGVQIHVTDRSRFRPFRTGLELIRTVIQLWPDRFEWRQPPYEYEYERMPIDLLTGSKPIAGMLRDGANVSEIESIWSEELDQYRNRVGELSLYS